MRRFLTFALAGETYGVDILDVFEIIGMLPITRVPLAADAVRGVINLRGTVIPVFDLRRRFDLPSTGIESCILVARAGGRQFGVLVDQVSDVLEIADERIEPVPRYADDDRAGCLIGLANTVNGICLLLDISRAIASRQPEPAAAV